MGGTTGNKSLSSPISIELNLKEREHAWKGAKKPESLCENGGVGVPLVGGWGGLLVGVVFFGWGVDLGGGGGLGGFWLSGGGLVGGGGVWWGVVWGGVCVDFGGVNAFEFSSWGGVCNGRAVGNRRSG